MNSNYALYIKEREGKDIIETEQGFATYYFDEDSVYIADVYVRPEYRNKNVAKDFFETIEEIAKEKGLKECITYADTSAKGYEISKSALLSNSFEIIGFVDNMVFFKRNL